MEQADIVIDSKEIRKTDLTMSLLNAGSNGNRNGSLNNG
jgi:hypothetical protein